jgi:hypothetical protein
MGEPVYLVSWIGQGIICDDDGDDDDDDSNYRESTVIQLTTNDLHWTRYALLLCSQQLATWLYPEPAESSPHPSYIFFTSIAILQSHLRLNMPSGLFLSCRPIKMLYFFFSTTQQPPVGQGLLTIEASRSHSDTSHPVGLLWTSDQPDAEPSTWQHTRLTTDIHAPGGIRTHNTSKRAAADPRLRRRSHWNQLNCRMHFSFRPCMSHVPVPDSEHVWWKILIVKYLNMKFYLPPRYVSDLKCRSALCSETYWNYTRSGKQLKSKLFMTKVYQNQF